MIANVEYEPVVPVKAKVNHVTLTLTVEEALYLQIYFGVTSLGERKKHLKQACVFNESNTLFDRFYPAYGPFRPDTGTELYRTLVKLNLE
jgi:hypothetical protein